MPSRRPRSCGSCRKSSCRSRGSRSGGRGAIKPAAGVLEISQTRAVHAAIVVFCERLCVPRRDSAAQRPAARGARPPLRIWQAARQLLARPVSSKLLRADAPLPAPSPKWKCWPAPASSSTGGPWPTRGCRAARSAPSPSTSARSPKPSASSSAPWVSTLPRRRCDHARGHQPQGRRGAARAGVLFRGRPRGRRAEPVSAGLPPQEHRGARHVERRRCEGRDPLRRPGQVPPRPSGPAGPGQHRHRSGPAPRRKSRQSPADRPALAGR